MTFTSGGYAAPRPPRTGRLARAILSVRAIPPYARPSHRTGYEIRRRVSTMPNFPGLDPLAEDGTAVAGAQRFLASAYDSVANLFDNVYPLVRGQRDAKRGRLTHVEQDVFRSAIVFAGAGVDSTLKELIRLAVPSQVTRSDRARDKFRNFSADHLGGRNGVDPKALAELIIEPDPQAALLASIR